MALAMKLSGDMKEAKTGWQLDVVEMKFGMQTEDPDEALMPPYSTTQAIYPHCTAMSIFYLAHH